VIVPLERCVEFNGISRRVKKGKGISLTSIIMGTMYIINACIGVLFLLCYAYQLFYIGVAIFKKKKPHTGKEVPHKFAVMISARNEENVIGGLIDSIKKQDYPSELVTVFVVADNCTDNTAEISRKAGAVVYERFDTAHVGKGFALEFLLDNLKNDYPRDAFDAYFVFDADNILMPNYITEMNKTYCDGYKAFTSYRNSKNYGDNWISAGYSLWFLREAKYLNNSRMILGTSCAISGTGFMIDRSLLEDEGGYATWKYFLLTEDIEFTTSKIIDGEIIGYCDDAVFYDEQPVTFKQSWDQRMRWAKGFLQVFRNYGKNLIRGLFGKKKTGKEKRSGKSRFSCFDVTMTIMPAMILTGTVAVSDLVGAVVMLCLGKFANAATLIAMPILNASLVVFLVGLITTVTEWRSIHTKTYKKILFTFTFPFFMLTYIPIAMVAIFKKVEWKPISHSKVVTLDEIHAEGAEKESDRDSFSLGVSAKAPENNE